MEKGQLADYEFHIQEMSRLLFHSGSDHLYFKLYQKHIFRFCLLLPTGYAVFHQWIQFCGKHNLTTYSVALHLNKFLLSLHWDCKSYHLFKSLGYKSQQVWKLNHQITFWQEKKWRRILLPRSVWPEAEAGVKEESGLSRCNSCTSTVNSENQPSRALKSRRENKY